MNKCRICKKKGELFSHYMKSYLCKRCFTKNLFNRIRKTIKKNSMLAPKEKVVVVRSNSTNYTLLKDFLLWFNPKMPITVYYAKNEKEAEKLSKKHKAKVIFLTNNANYFAVIFLKHFFDGKKIDKIKIKFKKKTIVYSYPLFDISNLDLEMYAESKGVRYKSAKIDKKIENFIEATQKRKPGVVYSIVAMARELKGA